MDEGEKVRLHIFVFTVACAALYSLPHGRLFDFWLDGSGGRERMWIVGI